MIDAVTGIDDAFINMSRIATTSVGDVDSALQNIRGSIYDVAGELGASATELADSTTEFGKLGYDINDAFSLAQSASKYATTGWLDLKDATDALTGSYTVFGGQFDETIGKVVDANTIIDLFNATGNQMAITSGDIGVALQDCANSMKEAGNSLSDTVALVATANKTVQDASKIGKMIA